MPDQPSSAERYRSARDARLSELTGKPTYRRTLVLCAVPGVLPALVGIAVAPITPVAGVVLGVAGPIIYRAYLGSQASAAAKDLVMHQWAQEHGWEYLKAPPLPDDVAFCRDRQNMEAADG